MLAKKRMQRPLKPILQWLRYKWRICRSAFRLNPHAKTSGNVSCDDVKTTVGQSISHLGYKQQPTTIRCRKTPFLII